MMRKPSKPGKRPRGAGKNFKAAEAQSSADLKSMAGAPVAFIEIDAAISGGYIHNRFDLTIRGRVMSATPLREVRLQVEDQVISLASYAQSDRAVACVLPDGRPGRQRAYQFYLPRTGDTVPGKSVFDIIACTEDDIEHT